MPMAAVIHSEAAVVRPWIEKPARKITPAQRKPMPVRTPWAMRVGSLTISEADQNVGPESRSTAAPLALEADQSSGQHRGQQRQDEVGRRGQVHRSGNGCRAGGVPRPRRGSAGDFTV